MYIKGRWKHFSCSLNTWRHVHWYIVLVSYMSEERTCYVHFMNKKCRYKCIKKVLQTSIKCTLKWHVMYIARTCYVYLKYMECTFCSATNLVKRCIGCTLWIRSMYFTCTCNVHFADREPTCKVHWMYIESTLKRHPYTTFNFIREWM